MESNTINDKVAMISVLKKEDGVKIFQASSNPIPYVTDFDVSKIKQCEVKNLVEGCFVLHNVLTDEECDNYIKLTETMGYELAKITTSWGMITAENVRNNTRVMWQTESDVWQPIWNRVQHFIPPKVNLYGKQWTAYGLNERFRFYRYNPGESFKPHYDGCFPRNRNDMSMSSFIIYLNDNFVGGETTFFIRGKEVKVQPKKGSVLIFWHGDCPSSFLHEGSVLSQGTKYVLRTDVMYQC